MLRFGYKYGLLLVLSVALFRSTLASETAGDRTPILVELFTSEGCSDCPPADAFLKSLDSAQPIAGAQLIVLEEHVDYWDDQGWRDPFSSHAFTVRQTGYVDRLHLASAYTPQMVVDGSYQLVGSDRRSAGKAFESARTAHKLEVHISSLGIENGVFRARIETEAVPSKADVFVAIAAESAQSQVAHGENGGRHLEHVSVAQTLTKIGTIEKGRAFSKDFSISAKSIPQPVRLIVFLQEPGQGRILGAAVEHMSAETAARN